VFGRLVQSKSGAVKGFDLYVGNSAGSCSIKVATAAHETVPDLARVGSTSKYRILWTADSRDAGGSAPLNLTVKMVEFTVTAGSIAEPLPLAVRELHRDPTAWSGSVPLSLTSSLESAGGEALITRQWRGAAPSGEVKRLDIGSCVPSCLAPELVYSNPDVRRASYGVADDNRIYLHLNQGDEIVTAFLEDGPEELYGPLRVILDPLEWHDLYPSDSRRLGGGRIGRIDWDVDSVPETVLAVTLYDVMTGRESIVLFDIEACGIDGTGSCLGADDLWRFNEHVDQDGIGNGFGWNSGNGTLLRVLRNIQGQRYVQAIDPVTEMERANHGIGSQPSGIRQ